MGDNDHTNDEGASAADTDTDEQDVDETEDDANTSKNTDANDDDTAGGSSEDGDDTDGTGDSDDKSGTDTADSDDSEDDDDGDEPETRQPKTNAEFAARRVANKEAKQAAKESVDEGDGDSEDTDDNLSAEDASAIDKRIDERLGPILKREAEQEVDTGIAGFLKDNPDFKPYEAKVRRWALHETRKNLPVSSIFYEVAGKKLMFLGAKRQKDADAKAKHSQAGGGSNADTEAVGNKSYKNMPLDEFGKELDAAKVGGNR